MVSDRRAADKVGPLTRWAGARVDHDERLRSAPLAEQVEYFAHLMPDNLIGRHAVQHIEWALEYLGKRDYWAARRAERSSRVLRHRDQVTVDVRRILDAGLHKELDCRS